MAIFEDGLMVSDLKDLYQSKAEELLDEEGYPEDIGFYDLPDKEQLGLYSLAMQLVDEGLQEAADIHRESMELRKMEMSIQK